MPDPRRQFRVLYRSFLLRLVDLELLSAHGDIANLLAQFGGLLAALSFVFAIYLVPQYSLSALPPDQLALAAWGDQEFLIGTTMAVVGIFAVIAWDSVFPDRRDSLVLGLLPIGTRTIFAAKVSAIATGLGVAVVAVNIATGISFPFVAVTSVLGAARAFAAYWLTIAAAGSFVFCSLLAVQGIAAQVFSYRLFLRVSSFLQLAAFFLVLGVYFLTPGPSDFSITAPEYQRMIRSLPSFWFLGLYQVLKGSVHPVFGPLAARAVTGLAIVLALAAVSYALAYFRNMRRVIEQPDIAPADRTRPAARLLTWAVSKWLPTQLERAVVLFVARTLARSRQHRVILAAFGGIALAISLTFTRSILYGGSRMYSGLGFRPPPWFELNQPFLAAGFVMLFFAIIGTRAVFSLPATLKANWIFRLTAVHSPKAYFVSLKKAVYALAAGPIWIAIAILYLAVWPRLSAFAGIAVSVAIGIVMSERALAGFRKLPFACSYLPGKSNLRLKLGTYGFGFLFATWIGAGIEYGMLRTPARSIVLSAFLLVMVIAARRRWSQFAAAPLQQLQFEDVEAAEVSPLDLTHDDIYSRAERYVDVVNPPAEPTFAQRLRRRAKKVAMATAAVLVAGSIYEQAGQRLYPPPPRIGTLVDIGGRSLNIFCSGQGTPTVVFESGRGGAGYTWAYIHRHVTKFTRACWYDRAGYGWSDAAPYPHPASAIAEELHRLLGAAGVPSPYVLVGASFGGPCVRVYNRLYPAEVAGMVLADATHTDERYPITPPGGGYLPYFPRVLPALAQFLKHTGVLRLVIEGPSRELVPNNLTAEEIRVASSFEPRTFAEAVNEMDYESLLEERSAGGLGDRPLIVLTAGLPPTADDPLDARRLWTRQQQWIQIQMQLVRLSTRGTQVVLTNSHHAVQYERPDAIIDAVRAVVDQVRADARQ